MSIYKETPEHRRERWRAGAEQRRALRLERDRALKLERAANARRAQEQKRLERESRVAERPLCWKCGERVKAVGHKTCGKYACKRAWANEWARIKRVEREAAEREAWEQANALERRHTIAWWHDNLLRMAR